MNNSVIMLLEGYWNESAKLELMGEGSVWSNSTGEEDYDDTEESEEKADKIPIAMVISFLVALVNLIGNSTLICTIVYSSTFRKPANFLIGNLSLGSLLFMTSLVIRRLEGMTRLWGYNDSLCRLFTIFHKFPITLISLTTIVISRERRRIIRNPLSHLSYCNVFCEIIAVWIFSIVILIPLAYTRAFDKESDLFYQCKRIFLWHHPQANIAYGLIYLLIIHVIPALILLFDMLQTLYTLKILSVCKVRYNAIATRANDPVCSTPNDRRLLLMRNSCIYAAIFILCWLPLGVFRFPLDLPPHVLPEQWTTSILYYWIFFKRVAFLHVSLNPLLLFILSHDLRSHFSFCFSKKSSPVECYEATLRKNVAVNA